MGIRATLLGVSPRIYKNNISNVLRKVLEQYHPGVLETLKNVVPASHYAFIKLATITLSN